MMRSSMDKNDFILRAIVMTVLAVSSQTLVVDTALAQTTSDTSQPLHICVDESVTKKRFYSSIAGIPHDYQSDQSKYVLKARSTDTLIDVREQRFDRPLIKTRINGALRIPLNQIKTKSYLMEESLLLVGDGLDGYFLEKAVDELQQKGFKHVKILEHGIVGFQNDERLLSDGMSAFSLKVASAERLIGAAIGDKDGSNPAFRFINLSQSHSIFSDLGVESEKYQFQPYQIFYKSLRSKVDDIIKSNSRAKVVIVHDDESIYRDIFLTHQSFKKPNVWFMQGGNGALTELQQKIHRTAVARNKVVISCHS